MFHDNEWLEDFLKWLRLCRQRRDEISWKEAVDPSCPVKGIDPSWLMRNGFGPPTVEIGPLVAALVDENPRTSGPPPDPTLRAELERSIESPEQGRSARPIYRRSELYRDLTKAAKSAARERRITTRKEAKSGRLLAEKFAGVASEVANKVFDQRSARPAVAASPVQWLTSEALGDAIRDALRTAMQGVDPNRPLNGKDHVLRAMSILRERGIRSGTGALKDRVTGIADAEFAQYRRAPGHHFKGSVPTFPAGKS